MDAVKNDIRAHLRKVTEASAKQLAKATGHSETEIDNALNSMRVYAEVECEQGGRGKGMIYWLTNAAAGDDKVCCGAAKVMGVTAVEVTGELRTKLDNAEARIREVEAERDAKAQRIEELEAAAQYREGILADYKKQFDEAREQLAAANALLMEGEEAIDVKDAASGYLVRAPKRKPRFLTKPESAVEAARGAAKSTGRAEVLALVPVGVAVRKKVKSVEYKKARAA